VTVVVDMSAPVIIEPEIGSSFDALLDMATATGARLTWGRTRLIKRHWVAVELVDGRCRARRARTRAEAAQRLLRDVYREPDACPRRF
jgi:hypothetical protein